MAQETEQELFARTKLGDAGALSRLQACLEAPMQQFVYRLVGPQDATDDMLRTAFFALYSNRDRIAGEMLRPFLYRVLRNLCYKELRRQGRFRAVSLDAPLDSGDTLGHLLPDGRPPPEEEVHWILLHAEVQKARGRLPELQRQTLILYCDENLTYAQIAEAMDTDIGTVKSRLHAARRTLLRLLPPGVAEAISQTRRDKRC